MSKLEHINSDLQNRNDDLEKRTDDLRKRADCFEKRNDDLEGAREDFEKKFADLEKKNDNLENQVTRMTSDNQWLKVTVADLTEHVAMLSDEASNVAHEVSALTGKPDTYTQFTSFACSFTSQTLSCPNSRTIFVTSAYYGQYFHPCDDCCPANPQYDCTVDMEEDRLADWLEIKELCDNQISCQLDNSGSVIDECQAGYTSDYAQIFYDCLPADETGPVGFTAYANTGGPTPYADGELVVFDVVISNFGGHYNTDTSSFVCPFDGVYMVNVNVIGYDGELVIAAITRNDVELVEVWSDDLSGLYTQASNTVMTECQTGDVLWIKSRAFSTMLHALGSRSTFSAFLMHRL